MGRSEKVRGGAWDETLSAAAIDRVAERIDAFLGEAGLERADRVRVRLSMEEALLRWQDGLGDGGALHLELSRHRGRPELLLTLEGEACDPLEHPGEQGDWAMSMLHGAGLEPLYSYRAGQNVLQLRLPRTRTNPALTLLFSVAVGVFIGLLGQALIPADARRLILQTVLDPIQNAFFRILNTAGSPVIFLSVLAAMCGIGRQLSGRRQGRALLRRFLSKSALAALAALLVTLSVLGNSVLLEPITGERLSSGLDVLLQVIPSDLLSPLITGDSPQLILLALVVGSALLVVEPQSGPVTRLVEKLDAVGLQAAEWVSRLTPFFVSVLLILNIWNGSLTLLLSIWRPLLIFVLFSAALLTVGLLAVCSREKLALRLMVCKLKKSFWTAFRNASVDSAYAENLLCCENELGIRPRFAEETMPFGLIVYMPAGTVSALVFTMCMAAATGVPITWFWLLKALVLAVALEAAAPPVAGVGLLGYAVIFAQLGIPQTALPVAMVADILFSFLVSACNQTMLQLELILEAGRRSQLDREILRNR